MAKTKSNKSKNNPAGLKGFFLNAGKSFYKGGVFAKDKTHKLAILACKFGFIFATTCIVAFVPLVFEIAREGQVNDNYCCCCISIS